MIIHGVGTRAFNDVPIRGVFARDNLLYMRIPGSKGLHDSNLEVIFNAFELKEREGLGLRGLAWIDLAARVVYFPRATLCLHGLPEKDTTEKV